MEKFVEEEKLCQRDVSSFFTLLLWFWQAWFGLILWCEGEELGPFHFKNQVHS